MSQIDAAQLKQRMQNGELLNLLDVREAMEYHTYNIGGANIPLARLQKDPGAVPYNKTDQIIVICSAGIRSNTALQLLTQSGFQNVLNLKGGLLALQKLNNKR